MNGESTTISTASKIDGDEHSKQTIEKAREILHNNEISDSDLEKISMDLMKVPNINEEISDEKILEPNSFELIEQSEINPVFLRNLLNLIFIINFIWSATKKDIDRFHKALLKIGVMFAFSYRNDKDLNDGIDYVMMCPLPNIVYSYIIQYGVDFFDSNIKLSMDKKFFNLENQTGIMYQESSVSELLNLFDENETFLAPKIMYYLKREKCEFLFKEQIFNKPDSFLNLKYTKGKYFGFNEIDISLYFIKEKNIDENYSLNYVKKNGVNEIISNFDLSKSGKINFPGETNIFIEFKKKIDSNFKTELETLKKISSRFYSCYKNPAYDKLNPPFCQRNFNCYFIYNSKRSVIKNNYLDEGDKSTNICYNSVSAQIPTIASMQNNIRKLNSQVTSIKEELSQEKKSKEKLNFQVNFIQEELLKEKKTKEKLNNNYNILENDHKKLKTDYNKLERNLSDEKKKRKEFEEYINNKLKDINNKIKNRAYIEIQVENILKIKPSDRGTQIVINNFTKEGIQKLQVFSKMNSDFINLSSNLENTDYEDTEIINSFKNIIGKKISTNKDKEEYLKFINLLNDRIKTGSVASKYYEAFRKCLLGQHYSPGKQIYFYNTFYGKQVIINMLNKLFYLIELLNCYDEEYLEIYQTYLSKKSIEESVIFVIESMNVKLIK